MAVFISGFVTLPTVGKDSFSENDWGTVIKACQMRLVPDSWVVGDRKVMNINGTDYEIVIIGKNHDVYSDGTGIAPLTFQLRDCYATDYAMNGSHTNVGSWEASIMRTTHLPAILATMPIEVKGEIREVNKLTTKNSTTKTTADKLFLLSEVEIFGVVSSSDFGEGTQYDYYANGYSTVKSTNGVAKVWLQRSPLNGNGDSFCAVNVDGGAGSIGGANSRGVSFAFCF